MHQQSCHISFALMDLITSSQLMWDVASRLSLPRDILLWVSPSSIWTLQLRGTHSVLSRLLTLLCRQGRTLQRHCGQGSRLGQPVFRISFGWRGGIGRSNWVKAPWGLLVLPDRQHIWRDAWPSDIPPCWHCSSWFSSNSTFLLLLCR